MQINKHKYSMAKDDIVIGLGRPMYGSSVHANRKKAYPSVITTLGQMEKEVRRWIAVHNFMCRSYLDSDTMKKAYVTIMCSDQDAPLRENYREAHKLAEISPDKRKHIRFQVGCSLFVAVDYGALTNPLKRRLTTCLSSTSLACRWALRMPIPARGTPWHLS